MPPLRCDLATGEQVVPKSPVAWIIQNILELFPEIVQVNLLLFPGCQVASQGRHVILFRVQGKMLQIARILHSAMDFPSHLKGNE